jgi:hypothetical protein
VVDLLGPHVHEFGAELADDAFEREPVVELDLLSSATISGEMRRG